MPKMKNADLIRELRRVLADNTLHSMTFVDEVRRDDKPAVEQLLRDRFRVWSDSWVVPLVDEIEARLVKPKRNLLP